MSPRTTPWNLDDLHTAAAPLDGRVPAGPIESIWDQHRFHMKLINPANRRDRKSVV